MKEVKQKLDSRQTVSITKSQLEVYQSNPLIAERAREAFKAVLDKDSKEPPAPESEAVKTSREIAAEFADANGYMGLAVRPLQADQVPIISTGFFLYIVVSDFRTWVAIHGNEEALLQRAKTGLTTRLHLIFTSEAHKAEVVRSCAAMLARLERGRLEIAYKTGGFKITAQEMFSLHRKDLYMMVSDSVALISDFSLAGVEIGFSFASTGKEGAVYDHYLAGVRALIKEQNIDLLGQLFAAPSNPE